MSVTFSMLIVAVYCFFLFCLLVVSFYLQEIASNPQLFDAGADRSDIEQGYLGDCWLLASLSCLSMRPQLLKRVVPSDQGFDADNYCGAFHFYFWRAGADIRKSLVFGPMIGILFAIVNLRKNGCVTEDSGESYIVVIGLPKLFFSTGGGADFQFFFLKSFPTFF